MENNFFPNQILPNFCNVGYSQSLLVHNVFEIVEHLFKISLSVCAPLYLLSLSFSLLLFFSLDFKSPISHEFSNCWPNEGRTLLSQIFLIHKTRTLKPYLRGISVKSLQPVLVPFLLYLLKKIVFFLIKGTRKKGP